LGGGDYTERPRSAGRQAQVEALRDELRAARRQMEAAARREFTLKQVLRQASACVINHPSLT
jgi:hypothetical protein